MLTDAFANRKANSALTHQQFGAVILPTVVVYSRMLAKLATGLDKRPDLVAQLSTPTTAAAILDETAGGGGGGGKETLPERAANIIRQAFVTCLNDRSGPVGVVGATGTIPGRLEGKKSGIYTIANLCLKILFQVCSSYLGEADVVIL